jgi:hypothetical protein
MKNSVRLRELLRKMHMSRVEIAQRLAALPIDSTLSAAWVQKMGMPVAGAFAVAALFRARKPLHRGPDSGPRPRSRRASTQG